MARIFLEHGAPEKAFKLARSTRNIDAAALSAKYCQGQGNFRDAIEFLLIARRNKDAFELAQAHDEMDHYADMLIAVGQPTQDELLQVSVPPATLL